MCDQIRQEVNGKLLLIGVYTSSVVFQNFPAAAEFSLFARCHFSKAGDYDFNVELEVGKSSRATVGGKITIEDASLEAWLPIYLPPISLPGATTITASYLNDSDEKIRFFSIPVNQGKVASH
jgi:hypothetical protein